MKLKQTLIAAGILLTTAISCQRENYSWLKIGIDRAKHQLMLTASEIDGTGKLPRSIWVGSALSRANAE